MSVLMALAWCWNSCVASGPVNDAARMRYTAEWLDEEEERPAKRSYRLPWPPLPPQGFSPARFPWVTYEQDASYSPSDASSSPASPGSYTPPPSPYSASSSPPRSDVTYSPQTPPSSPAPANSSGAGGSGD